MLARILGGRHRLAWNNSGANLASGVASTLLSATDAELGLLEVDEFALPEVMRRVRPRVVSLGNLFRDQLDRYGELEHIAERWRDAVASSLRPRRSSSTPTTLSSRELADGRAARSASASTTHGSPVRRSSMPPTRSTASAAGRRTSSRPPTSAISATTAARPAATRGRRSTSPPGRSSCTARRRRSSTSSPRPERRACGCRCPASTTSTTHSPRRRSRCARARRSTTSRRARGFTAAFGRFERIEAGDRQILMLLIKNPAGANEAIRTLDEGGVPRTLVVALNDRDRRRTRRVVDLGRRLRAAARARRTHRRHRRARGRARAPLHYAASPPGGSR